MNYFLREIAFSVGLPGDVLDDPDPNQKRKRKSEKNGPGIERQSRGCGSSVCFFVFAAIRHEAILLSSGSLETIGRISPFSRFLRAARAAATSRERPMIRMEGLAEDSRS